MRPIPARRCAATIRLLADCVGHFVSLKGMAAPAPAGFARGTLGTAG